MARRYSAALGEQSLRGLFDLALNSVYYRHVERHRILLACMPKSGSTFLSNTVGRLPGFRKIALTRHYGRVEQDISFSLALRKYKYSYICQQHVRYNARTAEAIETFDLTPVVLVRNIYDCVVSLRDHLRRESIETPMAYLLESHLALEDAEIEALIVDLAVPWYVNFYVSWMFCPNALWLTYEDVVADPAKVIATILERAGAKTDGEKGFGKKAKLPFTVIENSIPRSISPGSGWTETGNTDGAERDSRNRNYPGGRPVGYGSRSSVCRGGCKNSLVQQSL